MQKAILAAVCLKKDIEHFAYWIEEFKNLASALSIEVVAECIQQLDKIDPASVLGSGKALELSSLVTLHKTDLVIFFNDLSFSQNKRLSEICHGATIIDRTHLIIDIFTQRSNSKEAKIQTEIARLSYDLPIALENEKANSREKGGNFNSRGSGQSRSEQIKNRYRARINDLKSELKELEKQRSLNADLRNKDHIKKVALVGYTNAGKSSLMNILLAESNLNNDHKRVFEKDMLFATLDTSTRLIKFNNYKYYLFDTVGFVSNLPHELIEAFKSTLSVTKEADLLILVNDASNPSWEIQKEICLNTLKTIGADHIPIIEVFNKCDLINYEIDNKHLYISARMHTNIEALNKLIVNNLYPKEESILCIVPYLELGIIDKYKTVLKINHIKYADEGAVIQVSGSKEKVQIFEPYRIKV